MAQVNDYELDYEMKKKKAPLQIDFWTLAKMKKYSVLSFLLLEC